MDAEAFFCLNIGPVLAGCDLLQVGINACGCRASGIVPVREIHVWVHRVPWRSWVRCCAKQPPICTTSTRFVQQTSARKTCVYWVCRAMWPHRVGIGTWRRAIHKRPSAPRVSNADSCIRTLIKSGSKAKGAGGVNPASADPLNTWGVQVRVDGPPPGCKPGPNRHEVRFLPRPTIELCNDAA